jgi:hypothetical protein
VLYRIVEHNRCQADDVDLSPACPTIKEVLRQDLAYCTTMNCGNANASRLDHALASVFSLSTLLTSE